MGEKGCSNGWDIESGTSYTIDFLGFGACIPLVVIDPRGPTDRIVASLHMNAKWVPKRLYEHIQAVQYYTGNKRLRIEYVERQNPPGQSQDYIHGLQVGGYDFRAEQLKWLAEEAESSLGVIIRKTVMPATNWTSHVKNDEHYRAFIELKLIR